VVKFIVVISIDTEAVSQTRLTLCCPMRSVPIANDATIRMAPPMPISTAEPITWSAGVLKNVIVHNHAQPHNVNRIPSTMDD